MTQVSAWQIIVSVLLAVTWARINYTYSQLPSSVREELFRFTVVFNVVIVFLLGLVLGAGAFL